MNVPIYDGNPVWDANAVPFGFYNNQTDFQVDAVKVAKFCAARLGYPLVDIELQSGSFFTAFEEAVTIYGNELYAYTIRDNQLSLEGATTGSNLNQALITPNFEPIVRLTEQYGAEAGSGGNVPWYSGSFVLTSSIQDYSFSNFLSGSGLTGSNYNLGLEVKRVFYQEPVPASAALLSPYSGFGFGGSISAGLLGVGGFGGGMGFLMMPLNYDMQVIQSIEMNQTVRRNNYSFEIKNDKLRLFPIPTGNTGIGVGNDLVVGNSLTLNNNPTTTANINAILPLTGISGTGATGKVYSDGVKIYKVEVVTGGSGYIDGDTVTISQNDLLNAGFTVANAAVNITISTSNLPLNTKAGRVWFEYILRNERIDSSIQQLPTQVTNVSNSPYNNPNYDFINSVGRQWVFEYSLALSKEMLGYVRGKYSSIPIPNAEVNLNQGDLISAATAEKTALIERLRAYFDETSRQALLNRRASEAEAKMTELQQVPYTIYVA